MGHRSTVHGRRPHRRWSDPARTGPRRSDPLPSPSFPLETVASLSTISLEVNRGPFRSLGITGRRNRKHRQQWQNTLDTYAFPIFGDLPVDTIDAGLVMQAIEPIWTTKTETASRLRGRIEAVLDWAKTRGHRSGENSARWRRPESTPFAQFTRLVLAKTRLNLTSETCFASAPPASAGLFFMIGRAYQEHDERACGASG